MQYYFTIYVNKEKLIRGHTMNHYFIFILFIAFFGYSACNDQSFNKKNDESQIRLDSLQKVWNNNINEDSLDWVESGGENADEKDELTKHPFFGFYSNKKVNFIPIACTSDFAYSRSHSIDSILSYMSCIKDKPGRVSLLRRALIIAKYHQSRLEDSLRFLTDSQLLRMISYAYHQDIPSDALESNGPEFDSLYQTIYTLITKSESKAVVLKFINDSIFNYYYMRVEFSLPTKNILMLNYNAAGMAGSAEKRYFLKQGNNYKELNLHSIISIVDKKMTKIAKEDASADTDRFEGLFTWNEKKGMHQLELFVHVSSGASCCPPYIVQLYTKDFKTIEPGSLKYATTEHFSDSTIKPVWKNIR